MRHFSRTHRVLVSTWVLMGMMSIPALSAEADFRPADLLAKTPASSGASSLPGDIEGAWQTILGEATLPVPCGTSVVTELGRSRDRLIRPLAESHRLLRETPGFTREELRETRDGRFAIHYTTRSDSPHQIDSTDQDFNGIPDRIDQVADLLVQAGSLLHEQRQWPLPLSPSRSAPYDIYLLRLGSGVDGFVAPADRTAGRGSPHPASHMVIDSRIEGYRLQDAVLHQYAHASLLAVTDQAPIWWAEGSAAWLEMEITGDPSPHQSALSHRLERFDRSLTEDSLLLATGNTLWVSFLAERQEGFTQRIRHIWHELALRAAQSTTIEVIDEILSRQGSGNLASAYREFTRWVLFTGDRSDGEHFSLGPLFPPLSPAATHRVLPVESVGTEQVEPLGARFIRFIGDGNRGGLQVALDMDLPANLEVDMVISPSGSGARPYLIELTPDEKGRIEFGVPWRGVSEAVMIVRQPEKDGQTGHFRYTARMDPLYPFDLSSLTAFAAPGGVTLEWSTASETDLLGWNVYRSSGPRGPFLRVNLVALPCGGDSDQETFYIYQDTSAKPGRRYHYFVEGLTVEGLAERSFPVSSQPGSPSSDF